MANGRDQSEEPREVSDLIGAEIAVALMVWLLATIAAFWLIGAMVGVILVAAGAIGFGWFFVAAIRRADISG